MAWSNRQWMQVLDKPLSKAKTPEQAVHILKKYGFKEIGHGAYKIAFRKGPLVLKMYADKYLAPDNKEYPIEFGDHIDPDDGVEAWQETCHRARQLKMRRHVEPFIGEIADGRFVFQRALKNTSLCWDAECIRIGGKLGIMDTSQNHGHRTVNGKKYPVFFDGQYS